MYSTEELKGMLATGIVRFKYEKKDGTIREAIGTTNPRFISMVYTYKGAGGNDKTVPYWDLQKFCWRCCRVESIVEIERDTFMESIAESEVI